MKYITTILCALAFAISGISLALSDNNKSIGFHQTINAATVPQYNVLPRLQLDAQPKLSNEYNKRDTIYQTDTLYLKCKTIYKTKYLSAPMQPDAIAEQLKPDTPLGTTDVPIYQDVGVVREEQTTDSIGPPEGSIILIVDGEEVYKR